MTTAQPPQIAGHLLVQCLVEQGVTHAFGVPGESYLAVLDGFHRYRDQIQFVINRQEGGAAFMAEAHGKLTGRPGVCFVTRGPGASNASIGGGVAGTGAARDKTDTWPTREFAVRLGHKSSTTLLPIEHERDLVAVAVETIEHRKIC